MPLPLTISCSSKSRLVLPFRCQLTRVVPDIIQEGRKTVVCVCVAVKKTNKIVGVIKQYFVDRSTETVVALYESLVDHIKNIAYKFGIHI